VTLGALVPLSASLAACGGGGTKTDKLTSATVASTTATTVDVNTQILADYQGELDTYTRLIAAPNPDDAAIPQHMVDPLLRSFRDSLNDLLREGRVVRGNTSHHPRVVSVQGTTALIDDCVSGTQVRFFDAKTGQDLGAVPGDLPAGLEVTMRLDGGTWKNGGANAKAAACP
jgi:hypothetical protein